MAHSTPFLMSALISSTRHAVIRGPSFTGLGNRPDFTPAHQVDLPTGIGPSGDIMDESRTKPVSGNALGAMDQLRSLGNGAILRCLTRALGEFG